MTRGSEQKRFTLMVAQLIIFAYSKGYELTFGDAYRDPSLFGEVGESKGYGRANSLHKMRLAVDFNLFKGGKFLQETDDHKELGEFWESLGGSWGGRFNDGNHYSLKYRGLR